MNYDLIRHNIEVYENVKKTLPAISQYENGDIDKTTMLSIGLLNFSKFSDFIKTLNRYGFHPVMEGMTWRKLKPLLIKHTSNERFKKYLSNRTESDFRKILSDPDLFDRLLNGRWVRKPNPDSRTISGRSGRRDIQKIEGLKVCIVPILNYIIQHNLEFGKIYQIGIYDEISWYISNRLELKDVPLSEIEITTKLFELLVDTINSNKIDFRKLNLDYISKTFTNKISKLMSIPIGTRLKCTSDVFTSFGNKVLTGGLYYEVENYTLSNGSMVVYIKDDRGISQYYPYSHFEDVVMHRDDIINSLLGE